MSSPYPPAVLVVSSLHPGPDADLRTAFVLLTAERDAQTVTIAELHRTNDLLVDRLVERSRRDADMRQQLEALAAQMGRS